MIGYLQTVLEYVQVYTGANESNGHHRKNKIIELLVTGHIVRRQDNKIITDWRLREQKRPLDLLKDGGIK